MADAGLFIGWGHVVTGREEPALETLNESVELYGRLQEQGRIESFEVVLLEPHGADLTGFMLLRGSSEKLDGVHRDEEFQRMIQRASLVVDQLGVVPAILGEGLEPAMARYREQLAAVV